MYPYINSLAYRRLAQKPTQYRARPSKGIVKLRYHIGNLLVTLGQKMQAGMDVELVNSKYPLLEK